MRNLCRTISFTIRSFVGEEFPDLDCRWRRSPSLRSLAKRTFWEKATILHAEYHRPRKAAPGTLFPPLL